MILLNFTDELFANRLVSDCGRYVVEWSDHPKHGRYYNAWFGASPRKHLTGTFDKSQAMKACESHADKHHTRAAA